MEEAKNRSTADMAPYDNNFGPEYHNRIVGNKVMSYLGYVNYKQLY
jgi:hypothetical protein